MKFSFNFEGNKIDYELNTFWGTIKILVNDTKIYKGLMILGGKLSSPFMVNNKHLRVDVNQPIAFALFRNRSFEVYVNNQLYKVYNKKGNLITEHNITV